MVSLLFKGFYGEMWRDMAAIFTQSHVITCYFLGQDSLYVDEIQQLFDEQVEKLKVLFCPHTLDKRQEV